MTRITQLTITLLIAILAVVSKGATAGDVLTPIRVVLVEPDGEDFDQSEIDQSVASVRRAMDWWDSLAPVARPLVISETILMTTTTDIFSTTIDMNNSYVDTIYILDNSSSGRLINNVVFGAVTSKHQAWIVTGFSDMESTIAHEIGHLVFDLPDWYDEPGKCSGVVDIMCLSSAAYQQRFIGCFSLQWLGQPCVELHLPYMQGYPAP